ncbi:MAG: hypothetical protein ABI992_11760 [Chthoniobacterales bacterium]
MRCLFKILILAAVAGVLVYLWQTQNGPGRGQHEPSKTRTSSQQAVARAGGQTWGNPASLPDHFARHGADFRARNADEYARMAAQFLQRAKTEGLPAKVDPSGVLRVFDYGTGTFGAYNRNGTTKTFFKPGNSSYFARQPGRPIDLRTSR